MAGFTATLANWDALLEEDYVKGQIVSAINVATPFKDTLKRVGMTSGRERVYSAKVGASQGQGARAEGAQMPNYGAGEYQPVKVKAKYNYAPFKITGPSEEFGTKRAFIDFGLKILQDTKEGFKLFTGRQTWADGQGTLCVVTNNQSVGDTTITVQNAYGVSWGSLATATTFLLRRNMFVQFGTDDNNGVGYKIASVGTTTFTIPSPGLLTAVTATTKVSMQGSANNEITGALAFVGTASFMTTLGLSTLYNGIDRSLFPEFEGNVINAGGATLSLAFIRTIRDAIYKRTDDEESDLMIGSTEMGRDYEALLVAAQRFTPPNKLRGGHTVLSHDGLDFSKDSKAPIKALFFFCTKYIAWAQTREPHWLQDGNGIMRVVPGQDAKEALLKWYSDLDVEEPRRNGVLYNIGTN